MSQTPIIWTGNSAFDAGQTPFGFYDSDADFQTDADRVAQFCATRLGYPTVDIEMGSGSLYACFEEAVTVYGNEVYLYKIRENYLSLEGNPTGSVLNTEVITPTLGNEIRIAKTYGTEAGSGGDTEYYSGSIPLTAGIQDYDLESWSQASASLSPGDSIEIKNAYIINISVDFEIIVLPNFINSQVILSCIESLQEYFARDNWQINEPILINDLFVRLDRIEGVQTIKNINFINQSGTSRGYSQYAYDIGGATLNGVIYPSLDPSIFEIKYPNTDIKGKVVPL